MSARFDEMGRETDRYCSLVERATSFESEAFPSEPAASLAALLAAAAQLAEIEPTASRRRASRTARPLGT